LQRGAAVERLPTRAECETAATPDDHPLADQCAEATAAALTAVHAASDPGATKTPMSGRRRHALAGSGDSIRHRERPVMPQAPHPFMGWT
jgi:hypothetical protein